MKFDIKKRPAEFGVFNNRLEKNGPENTRKAIDLPVRVKLKASEIDIFVPAQGVKLSEFLYGSDLRKPQLQCPLLSPLKVHRKPENISLTIYDDPVDNRKKLTFQDVSVKDPTLELDGEDIFLSFKAQLHPDGHLQRISDFVENQTLPFECRATQPELFDADDPQPDAEESGEPEPDTKPARGRRKKAEQPPLIPDNESEDEPEEDEDD